MGSKKDPIEAKFDEDLQKAGIYILEKIRNFAKHEIQNGETLPKLNVGIYSKFGLELVSKELNHFGVIAG